MKKLLSILSAVVISATGASTVVACSDGMYNGDYNNHRYYQIDPEYRPDVIKAGLVSRAKSIILDKDFNFKDSISKQYTLNRYATGLKDIFSSEKEYKALSGMKVIDTYDSYIDDSSLSKLDDNSFLNGDLGEEGGIFKDIAQTAIAKIMDAVKIPDNVSKILKPIINNLLGLVAGDSGKQISEAIKPIMGAVGNLNVQTAMSGIPYALTLVPDIKKSVGAPMDLIKQLVTAIKSKVVGLIKDPITKFIDGLATASDLTSMATKKGNELPDLILEALKGVMNPPVVKDKVDYASAIGSGVQLINLAGDYLSMIPHDEKQTGIDAIAKLSSQELDKTVYYEIGEGKTFNMAPLLSEVSYYLSDLDNTSRVQKLLQVLFLSSKTELNSIGKFVVDAYLAPAINNLMGTEINKDTIVQAAIGLITDETSFNAFYSGDWEKLNIPGIDKFGEKVAKDADLNMIFSDDINYAQNEGVIKKNLKNLLNLPIYKLLALAGVKGFSTDDLKANHGLLPNYAGYYTQESIGQLVKEVTSIFQFSTSDGDNSESLKYHYFNFTELNDFLNDLLFDDEAFINVFADELSSYNNLDELCRNLATKLGYAPDLLANNNNPKFVYVYQEGKPNENKDNYTLMYKLITLLFPMAKDENNFVKSTVIDDKGNKSEVAYLSSDKSFTDDNINKSDNLKFLFELVSSFTTNIVKGTDYKYWLSKVINSTVDNVGDKSVFDYKGDGESDISWWPQGGLGINTTYFEDTNIVKTMTLNISFKLSNIPWLINRIPTPEERKKIYTFTISRDNTNDKLKFSKIDSAYGD